MPDPALTPIVSRGQGTLRCNCHPATAAPVLPRRALLGLCAGLWAVPAWAHGGEELLDPGRIGKPASERSSPPPAADLLDPAKLGTSRGTLSAATPADAQTRAAVESAGSARGMADAAVQALDSLTLACAERVRRMAEIDGELSRLDARLQALTEHMSAVMAEYRQGLFCSGCGRTKSDIESKGERFPHPGQTIVKPTAKQLADKERELQAPIDSAVAERDHDRTLRQRNFQERDEALGQISTGIAFWQTCISAEHGALRQEAMRKEARYAGERQRAQEQIARLKLRPPGPASAPAAAPGPDDTERERRSWERILQDLERRHLDEEQAAADALARASRNAYNESSTLSRYFNREDLRRVLSAVAPVTIMSPLTGFNELGGLFRLGDFRPESHDQVLPAVGGFVKRFQAASASDCQALLSGISCGNTRARAPRKDGLGELLTPN